MSVTGRPDNAEQLSPLIGSFTRVVGEQDASWSPELFEILGVPATHPATLDSLVALIHPDDRAWFTHRDTGWVTDELGRARTFQHVFRIIRPDGRTRLIDVRGWVRPGENGGAPEAQGLCRDITAAEDAARAHRHLAQQLEMLLATAGEPVCGVDDRGRLLYVNAQFGALVGRAVEGLIGETLHDVVHGDGDHLASSCPLLPGRVAPTGVDPAVRTVDGVESSAFVAAVCGGPPATAATIRLLRASADAAPALLRHAAGQATALRAERDRLAHALAGAEESERLRIAGDLHDDTVQALSAVALDLAWAMESLQGPPREALAAAAAQVLDTKTRLRQMMYELLPPSDDANLREAVAGYCHSLFADGKISYEISGDPQNLPIQIEVAAYRLIQEALRNVVRHSQGGKVRIDMHRIGNLLIGRVSDDGIGLGDGVSASSGHAGLEILRQRAQAVGGIAVLGSGLDARGASVELRLPLEPMQLERS